jgi:hypothetical protein
MSTIVQKQLVMSGLNLPIEMIDIIKDYCFHNIVEVAKQNKKRAIRLIGNGELTRINYDDTNPKWRFEIPKGNMYGDKFILDAGFCKDCGNYKYNNYKHNKVRYHDIVSCSPSIYCKCYNGYDSDEEDHFNYDTFTYL